jgi:hypothetical protein
MLFKQLVAEFQLSPLRGDCSEVEGVVETNCLNDNDFIKNDDSPGA